MTGVVAARSAGAGHDAVPVGHDAACLNCGTALIGSHCHACGQRAHVHRSLLHLGEELLHGLFHFEAKGLRTLPLLVLQPGVLTRRYVDGQRMRYVSPLALFLFMVFLMFFTVSLTNGMGDASRDGSHDGRPGMVGRDEAAKPPAAAPTASGQRVWVTGSAGSAGEHAVPAWAALLREQPVDTGYQRLDRALKRAADNPDLTLDRLKNTAYKWSFMLVPISLPFLWSMFFWRSGITMYDHAVFALYSLSFMSLLVAVLMLLEALHLDAVVAWLAWLVPPLHMGAQLRGTYSLDRWGTLWRTGALLFVSAVVLTLFIVFIVFITMR